MKTRNRIVASGLGLLLTGCPSDDGDGGDHGANSGLASSSTVASTSNSTTEPPTTTTGSSETTADLPNDTTAEPTDGTTDAPTQSTGDTTGNTTGPMIRCPEETTGAGAMSFETDVWPLLTPTCLGLPGTCHSATSGGLSMPDPTDAYANLVGVPSTGAPLVRVEPGCPDASYLLAKLNGTQNEVGGSGGRMPQGTSPLPQASLDTIEEWIVGGAQP
ncbi:MAG: hypothetical protein AAGF11_28265 [Myxococcota bacterium]